MNSADAEIIAKETVKSWTEYLDSCIKAGAVRSLETDLEQLERFIFKAILAERSVLAEKEMEHFKRGQKVTDLNIKLDLTENDLIKAKKELASKEAEIKRMLKTWIPGHTCHSDTKVMAQAQVIAKMRQAFGKFQEWFKSLPEKETLFTEGRNKKQDKLIEVFRVQFEARALSESAAEKRVKALEKVLELAETVTEGKNAMVPEWIDRLREAVKNVKSVE